MRERVERILGGGTRGVWVSTFHSTCVRILRRDVTQLGYEPNFVIYDQDDSLALVKRVLRAAQRRREELAAARRALDLIDRLKNRGLLPADLRAATSSLQGKRLREIYQRYQTELRRANALDFGDLILLTARLFENHPGVLARLPAALAASSWSTSTRTPTRSSTGCCACSDRRAPQPVRGRRRGPVDLPLPRGGHPQHPRLREGLPRRARWCGSSRTTARRSRSSRRRARSSRTTSSARARACSPSAAGGELVRFYEAADERGEAAFVVGELLRLRERGRVTRQLGDLLPHARAVAAARGGAAQVQPALRRRRRHALLRPRRGEGRPRLPARAAQPGRHREPAAHREHARARHRAHHDRARAGRPPRRRGTTFWDALVRGLGGLHGGATQKRIAEFVALMQRARRSSLRVRRRSRSRSRRCSSAPAICARSRPRTRSRPRRGSRT